MIEIPRLPNSEQHVVCSACRARTVMDQKVYCDISKLRQRPTLCPTPDETSIQHPDAYAMLRAQLRKTQP